MKKRFLGVLLVIAILFSMSVIPPLRAAALPDGASLSLSAESAVLIDCSDGQILYEKNAHARMGMASTTKIMTALVAAEDADIYKEVTVTKEAVGIEGSSVYLAEGEKLSLCELLYALLLASANDAAVAIAIERCGSVERFVERMNEKALELGLKDTHFVNPHGLYDEAHYTTAYELALISAEAIKEPTVSKIASTYRTSISGGGSKSGRFLLNHNKLLRLYDGAIGLKTGFTKKTGRCLVSAVRREGLCLIAVTLNAPDDWNDHIKLLDLGFESYEAVTLYDVGEFTYLLPVTGGKDMYALLSNTEAIILTLPKNRGRVTEQILTHRRFEFAPVREGAILGTLVCLCGGRRASSSLSVAAEVWEADNGGGGLFASVRNFFDRLFS